MTLIAWTDVTDNIIAVEGGGWWCRRVSSGCDNCYAHALNQNTFFGGNKLDYSGQAPPLILRESLIEKWSKQTKAKKHFVSSMTDAFGEWVPREWQFKMLDGMAIAPKQTFQLLTKRPNMMKDACLAWLESRDLSCLPENIWIGTTVENKITAKQRIPVLKEVPAAVRFLSCEPLLEDLGNLDLSGIHWVIIGGESGKLARYCHLDWMAAIVSQCQAYNVPVFVKQLGYRPVFGGHRRYTKGEAKGELIVTQYGEDGTACYQPISDRSGSKLEDFPQYLRVRDFPQVKNENATDKS